jgi:pre-mRNA-processing factor SLU7
LERPRKVLAKYTNEKLASDDVVPVELGRSSFEAKRDRWSNFIAEDYREKLADEGNYDDVPSRAGNKLMFTAGDTESLSVANLRVREDTAKYLLDLSGEGAHYDPKSRSMREVGDQFQRYSGEAEEMMKVRRQMAWDRSQTNEVSNPTEIALKLKREREEKKAILEKRRLELDTKYNS